MEGDFMTEGKEGSYQPSDEEVKKTELSLTSIEQEWSVYRDQRRLTSRSNFSEVHPNVKGWLICTPIYGLLPKRIIPVE